MYDQPNNTTFSQKIESVQYKAALAVTSVIQDTSQERHLDKVGLQSPILFLARSWIKLHTPGIFCKVSQNL